jgi:hypothetical protein
MKKLIVLIGIVGLIGGLIAYQMYTQPLKDMSNMDAEVQMSATDLYAAYDADEAAANAAYLGKIIEVTGVVQHIENGDGGTATLVLDTGAALGSVLCRMDQQKGSDFNHLQPGQQVQVKGECVGKLIDVEFTRCILI